MMDTQSAIKKTALKKAPRISARTHCRQGVSAARTHVWSAWNMCVETYAKGKFVGCGLLRRYHCPQTDGQRDNIVQLQTVSMT